MKPYSEHRFETATAKLHHCDALALLKSIATESVDLVVTSPPYFVGKSYDTSRSLVDFRNEVHRTYKEIKRIVKEGGSICWQVGSHVEKYRTNPLDAVVINILLEDDELYLKNRIIWTFGHGTHSTNRFSGRHETILWYSKGPRPVFNLDAVRVPQKYPGKLHYKGPKKGSWSGNPLGKNPGDVWDIPNVKARHAEKTTHPCQFPLALVGRLISSLSPKDGLIVDPYMGSGTTAVSALLNGRNFYGSDLSKSYVELTGSRILDFEAGRGGFREDKPVLIPNPQAKVSKRPEHFSIYLESFT